MKRNVSRRTILKHLAALPVIGAVAQLGIDPEPKPTLGHVKSVTIQSTGMGYTGGDSVISGDIQPAFVGEAVIAREEGEETVLLRGRYWGSDGKIKIVGKGHLPPVAIDGVTFTVLNP